MKLRKLSLMTLSVFMAMVRHEKRFLYYALPLPFTCTHAYSSDDDVVAKINRNIGIIVRNKITERLLHSY